MIIQAGVDSLAAVELRNSLSTMFAISLPATLIFDYPTIAAISSFVRETLLQKGLQKSFGKVTSEDYCKLYKNTYSALSGVAQW